MLVIHGTEDEVIDFSHGLAIYEKCPRAVEPLWVEGAGHNDVELYGQYLERLKQFINVELVNWQLLHIRDGWDSSSAAAVAAETEGMDSAGGSQSARRYEPFDLQEKQIRQSKRRILKKNLLAKEMKNKNRTSDADSADVMPTETEIIDTNGGFIIQTEFKDSMDLSCVQASCSIDSSINLSLTDFGKDEEKMDRGERESFSEVSEGKSQYETASDNEAEPGNSEDAVGNGHQCEEEKSLCKESVIIPEAECVQISSLPEEVETSSELANQETISESDVKETTSVHSDDSYILESTDLWYMCTLGISYRKLLVHSWIWMLCS